MLLSTALVSMGVAFSGAVPPAVAWFWIERLKLQNEAVSCCQCGTAKNRVKTAKRKAFVIRRGSY